MADTGIFATTAEVQMWVPTWASSTYNTETYINEFIAGWEAHINNNEAQINFSDIYSGLDADLKLTLHTFVCANVAMQICSMDTSGVSIRTAEFFFDHMTNVANTAERKLKEDSTLNKIKNS